MTGIFKLHQMISHFVVAENRVQRNFSCKDIFYTQQREEKKKKQQQQTAREKNFSK